MAIDFKNLLLVLPHVTSANHPVLLRGRHGIGKSSVVYQYASALGMPVVERRASQMTEGDLLGLPTVDEGVTSFCPPDWFATACDNGVVLFLDEVDRATLEVRQGIFELCDSRKLAGHALHPDTLIFAAVNGGTHAGAASYQVGEMDPAELDRYTVFDVEPSIDDWVTWSVDNCDALVTDFIRNNTEHLSTTTTPSRTRFILRVVRGLDSRTLFRLLACWKLDNRTLPCLLWPLLTSVSRLRLLSTTSLQTTVRWLRCLTFSTRV